MCEAIVPHCSLAVRLFESSCLQVVVENNEISGASLAAAGNRIATYNGGYAHHILMFNNSISDVWGGDREVMTYGAWFDCATWTATAVAARHPQSPCRVPRCAIVASTTSL